MGMCLLLLLLATSCHKALAALADQMIGPVAVQYWQPEMPRT
jgi:hypothetical protein